MYVSCVSKFTLSIPVTHSLRFIAFAKLFASQNERNPIFTTVPRNSLNKIDQIATIIFKREKRRHSIIREIHLRVEAVWLNVEIVLRFPNIGVTQEIPQDIVFPLYIDISSSGAEVKWIRSGTINRHTQDLPSVLCSTTARNKREARHVRLDSDSTGISPRRKFSLLARSYLFYSHSHESDSASRLRSARDKSFRSCSQMPRAAIKNRKNERRKCNRADFEKFISSERSDSDVLFFFFFFSLNPANMTGSLILHFVPISLMKIIGVDKLKYAVNLLFTISLSAEQKYF